MGVAWQLAAGTVLGDAPPKEATERALPTDKEEENPATAPIVDPSYEVVVTAKRPLSRDPTQDDVVVDGERLRNSPRSSTLEALSQENAGVYATGRGALHGVANGATGGISIRGLGGSPNSQVLVVEDGVPDYMGLFGHPIPDAYVPFLIEDALIVKGGDSVLYGTNAMGGVLVFRSRWLHRDGVSMMNDAAYGSYSTIRETASVLARKERLDLAGAVHVLNTEGHRDGAGGNEIVGQVAARYRLPGRLRLSLKDKVVHLRGGDPGPVTHPYTDHWYDVVRNNASLKLGWRRESDKLTVTPFLNLGVHRLYDGFLSNDYVGGGIAETDIGLNDFTDLLFGLSVQHVDGKVVNRITEERPEVKGLTDISLYSQITFTPLERLSIVLGGRALHSLRYGDIALYKGGIRVAIYRGLFASTRIAKNFRQPTIRELYLPFPTANPALRPELALNADVSMGYEGPHLDIVCTGYRTAADDMIRYFGAWPTAEVINIDHIVIWGVEARLGLKKLGPLSLYVSGDWKDVGRYTRQNPEAKLDFTLEASRAFGSHFLSGGLSGEWVHGIYMSNYGRDPIDDPFFMDLTLRYRYTSAKHGWTVEPYVFLRNLLDRSYAFVEAYPMPGFNLLAGVKVGI